MNEKECCFVCFYWKACPGCEGNNVEYGWCLRRDDFTEYDYVCNEGLYRKTRETFKNI